MIYNLLFCRFTIFEYIPKKSINLYLICEMNFKSDIRPNVDPILDQINSQFENQKFQGLQQH